MKTKTLETVGSMFLAGEVAFNWDVYRLALEYLVLLAVVLAVMFFVASKTTLKR